MNGRLVATTVPEHLHEARSFHHVSDGRSRRHLPRISVGSPQFFEMDRLPEHLRTFHLPMRAVALRTIVLGLLVVVGCGGGNGSAPIPSHLAAIEAEVFTPSCTFSSCHGATSPEQDMSLTSPAWARSRASVRPRCPTCCASPQATRMGRTFGRRSRVRLPGSACACPRTSRSRPPRSKRSVPGSPKARRMIEFVTIPKAPCRLRASQYQQRRQNTGRRLCQRRAGPELRSALSDPR